MCKLIAPQSLAYWHMDDGSLKKVKNTEAHILCTDSFSKAEVLLLGDMFKNLYDIHINYHLKDGKHRIYIPVRYTEKYRGIIREYMHESMKYKL